MSKKNFLLIFSNLIDWETLFNLFLITHNQAEKIHGRMHLECAHNAECLMDISLNLGLLKGTFNNHSLNRKGEEVA